MREWDLRCQLQNRNWYKRSPNIKGIFLWGRPPLPCVFKCPYLSRW
jgi:hypothetical protein